MRGLIYWRGTPVSFTPGETLAAVLARHGALTGVRAGQCGWRVFCGIGLCQQCVVIVDGEHVTEACLTVARDGMRVEPAHPQLEEADRD